MRDALAGASRRCDIMTDTSLSPTYGGRPVRDSNATQPKE
jgi:hypothetical protein